MRRQSVEIHSGGLVFRFLYDKADPTQLHIERAHGVSVAEATAAYFAVDADTVWIAGKRCFETRGPDCVLIWLWEVPNVRVFVISCIRREDSYLLED